jgi:hypothetical protein
MMIGRAEIWLEHAFELAATTPRISIKIKNGF